MGHGHGSVAAASASGRYVPQLVAAFCIGLTFMLLELVVGLITSSLALLSDAAHVCTDVLGIGMALIAVLLARRPTQCSGRTFGLYRAEVLAALANATLLFGVAGYVLYQAIGRIVHPQEVPGLPVMAVAGAALVANTVAVLLLRKGSRQSLNLRGAYLEVLSDLIGSLGVLISGVIIVTTGWRYADPIAGVALGLFVLPRTAVLARRALRILFQHAPDRLDLDEMTNQLHLLTGVDDVHDLHVWTLTSGMEVASAHLTTPSEANPDVVLQAAQKLLAERYHIEHATLQVESGEAATRCREITW